MKRTYLLLFCLVISTGLNAQSKAEKQVETSVEKLKQAMISGDRASLENIAADDLSYGHSSGNIENKAAFVESIASGKSDFVNMDLQDQVITVSGKTALVRHKLLADIFDGGKAGKIKLGVLLVFQKQKGEWKLLARQAFKL
ncbi:MAG: nuclear transport factor 2 family protein [Sphingobacteriaceae bacterium]